MVSKLKPKCCSKWEEKLGIKINWDLCFKYVHQIEDVNMKWFQMRILHRIIGTNVILKELGIASSDRCSFCNIERNNIQRMFWNCISSQQFWRYFARLINNMCETAFNMRSTECLVILGLDDNISYRPYLSICAPLCPSNSCTSVNWIKATQP